MQGGCKKKNYPVPFGINTLNDGDAHSTPMGNHIRDLQRQNFIAHPPINTTNDVGNKTQLGINDINNNKSTGRPKKIIRGFGRQLPKYDILADDEDAPSSNEMDDVVIDSIRGFYNPDSFIGTLCNLFLKAKRTIENNPTYLLEIIKIVALLVIVIFQFLIYRSNESNINIQQGNIQQQLQTQSRTPSADIGGI